MRPAFSVVFLTTLIGAAQGLFLALFALDAATLGLPGQGARSRFFMQGALVAVVLAALGLLASFFHLGRPERAWRAAAMWRTSWLSREVIVLPAFMALVAAYGFAHGRAPHAAMPIGALAFVACAALFYCTAMIYACIKFLPEWASPFTVANFTLMGCASGASLALALAALASSPAVILLAPASVVLTLAALVTRVASLVRNARLAPPSTLQTAIGIANPRIRQVSQGFTGESFNTLEFFHGRTPRQMVAIRTGFLILAFVVPVGLVLLGMASRSALLLLLAFPVQYAGLVMERWYFLAEGNHAQNLYYQGRS